MPLKKRVLDASRWSLVGYGLTQAIRFGTNLLLTRLLVPEMFGVMAIANLLMVGLAMISDLGLKQNIIQSKQGNDPVFLNTAWTVQILRGVALWLFALGMGLVVLLADRIGIIRATSAYADPRLPYVIAILSFNPLIGGFQSTKLFEARRNLSLGPVTKIEWASQFAGLLLMLGWAYVDRSIWALVAGSVFSMLVMVLMSHVYLPGIDNSLKLDKFALHEIIHFGKWIFVSSLFGFLVNNGDRLLLGAWIDAHLLGVYVIAFAIFNSAEILIDKIISDVSFSALSEVIRERPADLERNYYRFHMVIASIASFCSGILMFSGQSLIGMLYDPRYAQAGWMLEILAVSLLITPFHLGIECLLALGLPKSFAQIIGVRVVSLFLLVPLGFHFFSLPGALWALVASYSATLPMMLYYQIKYRFFKLWKTLLPMLTLIPAVLIAKLLNYAIGMH
jgi:O-antigen/teichoic acid export membrane protein